MASLTDLTLAYRQAKLARYDERRGLGSVRLARYEASLHDQLTRLARRRLSASWFDGIRLGDLLLVPKSVNLPGSEQGEERIVSIGAKPAPADISVRVQLDPHPDFSVLEVLYLWEFGPALDALLSDASVGYRLNVRDGAVDKASKRLFTFWPKAFADYRDAPIKAARSLLLRDGETACTVTSVDFTAFYDSIDPAFLLNVAFVDRLARNASEKRIPFGRQRYLCATHSLLKAFKAYHKRCFQLTGHPIACGVPIGALTSRLIANVLLAELDHALTNAPQVVLYRRYVDDLVIVARATKRDVAAPMDVTAFLVSWFPRLSANQDVGFQVDPGFGHAPLAFQRTKTRVHYLAGQAGLDFLNAVRDSFATAASERRAFAVDVEPMAEELEALAGPLTVETSRVVSLRDADRAVLERFKSGALFASLERIVRLLSPAEAASFLIAHEHRLLSALDHRSPWSELESLLSLTRIGLLARSGGIPGRLARPLMFAWHSMARLRKGVQRVAWNGRTINKQKALSLLAAYVQRRFRETVAASGPFSASELQATGLAEVAADLARARVHLDARMLRRADLRRLDREDDFLIYPASANYTPDLDKLTTSLARGGVLVRARLKKIAVFLDCVQALRDRSWSAPALSLFLSPRPPTYFDVSRRVLYSQERNGYSDTAFDDIVSIVNAVSGSAYQSALGRTVDPATLVVGSDDETIDVTRLMLGNLVLDPAWWTGAATASTRSAHGTPILSFERFRGLARVLASAQTATTLLPRFDPSDRRRRAALLVLPELSIPRAWTRELGRYIAKDGRLSVIAGIEYVHDSARRAVANQAFGIFPCGYQTVAVVPWTKRHPAEEERRALEALRLVLHAPTRLRRTIVHTKHGRLSTLICSELLEAGALSNLLGHIELLAVPAWNRDTSSFDHMIRSAGLLLHAFIGIANNGEHSDCRAWAPIKDPGWRREVCRLIQRHADVVVWEDIDTRALREFHERGGLEPNVRAGDFSVETLTWRPLPPSWGRPPRRR